MTGPLSPQLINELLRSGMKRVEIAEQFGVTRQALTYHINQLKNPYRTPREIALSRMPESWNDGMDKRFKRSNAFNTLRHHMEFVVTGGQGMTRSKLEKLSHWYRTLEERNLILEFDPEIPPSMNVKHGGWAYRPRVETDGDLVIRENEHTVIQREERDLWRLPSRRPSERDQAAI